jgi:uncharacterized membrane protein
MWRKTLWLGGLLLGLSAVGLTLVDAKPIDQPVAQSSVEVSGFSNDEELVILELSTPDYTLTPVDLSIGKFDRLTAPDRAYTDRAGYPQMPLQGYMIGVPPGARVELEILSDDVVQLPGAYHLSPAAEPAPLTGDLQPGQMRDVVNPAAYSANTLYPDQPARITQDVWLREQRIVRVELYPFQFRADHGELIWHRHLRVAVRFYRTAAPSLARSIEAGPSPFESVLRDTLVNYKAAKQWRAQPADQPLSISNQPVLNKAASLAPASASPDIKIVVDHDGLYRLTYTDLITAGVVLTGIDPGNFHLTSQQQDVAIYVSNQTSGVFASGDFIEFYGQKFRGDVLAVRYANESAQWLTYSNGWHSQFSAAMLEKYTDDNVYWLNMNGPAGPRMAAIDGTPDGVSPTPTYYTTTVHAEQSNIWWTYSSNTGSLPWGEDTWWWESVQNGGSTLTRTYTTLLSAIANVPQAAIVRGEVAARNENPAAAPDHRTRFWLNAEVAPLADSTWDGLTRYHFEAYVPQTDLISGTNQVRMTIIPQAALPNDNIYFDWFEIQYARLFQATGDQILFSDAMLGSRQYVITNFVTSTLSIYNITNPLLPQRILSSTLVSSGGKVTTTIGVSSTTPITYYVVGADALQKPKSITTYTPPDLSSASNGADYIIIAPTAFLTASQTLATYRAAQGLRVKVVDVADLYNQFNDGIYHPIAIKNFLAYAYSHWQAPAPAYAVLIGDGHWNFKNQGTYGAPTIYMPPFLAFVDPWQGEVDATNLLAAFVGNDILPDISIGRMPVNSVAELNTVISKTMIFEQAGPQAYQTGSLFLADNADAAGNFKQLSDELIANNYPTHFQAMRVYEDDLLAQGSCCRNGTNVITKTLNQTGTLLLVYSGHANIDRWADSLLRDIDIPQLTNLNRLPIVLSLTCLDGYWYFPTVSTASIMEQMVRAANGGAVATFSPSGLGLVTGHNTLASGVLDAIFKDGVQRLGPATIAGKVNVYARGDGLDLINTYTILGDPALRLPVYLINVSPTAAAKSGNSGTVVTYTLPITNLAYLYDQITVTLSGNAWSGSVIAPIVAPQSTASAIVSVTIPAFSLPGAVDVVSVTIASHGAEAPVYHAVLTTTTNAFYQFNLATATAAQTQVPGQVVTYGLQLTNSGNLTDTFTLSITGNIWPGSLSTYALTLPPFTSNNVVVSTTVPSAALMNDKDVLTVTVSSGGSGSQSQAFTTTTGGVYQSLLSPLSGQQSIDPGATATYTLWLTNTGNVTDAFNLTTTGNVWAVGVNPASTVGLPIGGSAVVVLTVTVPITALAGDYNPIGVLATSQGGGTQAQAVFTTTANPVYAIDLSPLSATGLDEPGAVVTYTLQITNTSNTSDTFDVAFAGNKWSTTANSLTVGLLPAQSASSLAVYVQIKSLANVIVTPTDSVSVTLTSEGDPGVLLSAVLTTTAHLFHEFNLSTADAAQTQVPGVVVTYTLQLTNSGNLTDTFVLSNTGNVWSGSLSTYALTLSPFTSTEIVVSTTVAPAALINASDVLTVVVVSSGNGQSYSQAFTTTAGARYQGSFAPTSGQQSIDPGATTSYTLWLTNTGNVTDAFDLTLTGNAWKAGVIPTSTASLSVGGSEMVVLTVTAPITALAGAYNPIGVRAASQGDGTQTQAVFTTTVNPVYAFALSSLSVAKSGKPGAVVTYTLQITNSSNVTDTFALSSTGNVWAGSLSVYSLTLPSLASIGIVVSTTVAPTALINQSDVLTVVVVSSGNSQLHSQAFTTTASARYQGSLAPTSGQQSIDPGATASYTLWLTNTGNVTDAFNLTVTDNVWAAAVSPASSVALPVNGSQMVVLTVTAPITALAGDSHSIGVLATSQGDGTQAQAVFTTTTKPAYAFSLSTLVASKVGAPGATVTYTLQITNSSNITDSFTLSDTSHIWPGGLSTYALTLPARVAGVVNVSTTVPLSALMNDKDVLTVTVISSGNSQLHSQAFTTTAGARYQGSLTPSSGQQSIDPGATASYTLWLTNTGNVTDVFNLAVTDNVWAAAVSPASSVALPVNGSQMVVLTVTAPIMALAGDSHSIGVLAVSQGSGTQQAQAIFTTTVKPFYAFALSPIAIIQFGEPNGLVTYTLGITNNSNISDTFTVLLANNTWPTTASLTTVGPLPARSVFNLAVYVHIDPFAALDSTGSVSVTIVSAGNSVQLSTVLTTVVTNTVFGLDLTSAFKAQSAEPDVVAVYTAQLTNTGGTTDTFTLISDSNGWPISINPNPVGPLSSTFGTSLIIFVTVPSMQVADTSQVVTITGISQLRGVSAQLQFTTTASAIYGLSFGPDGVSQHGVPAAALTYTLYLTNTGNTTDTFDLTPGGALSVFSLSAYSVTLAPFAVSSIAVTGSVPSAALFGDSFGLTLTAQSRGGGNQQAVALNLLTAAVYGLNLQPSALSGSSSPGSVVSYVLSITNTGNATDTFNLSYAGNGVNGQSEPSSVGPLDALSGAIFSVTVKVPDAAPVNSSDVVTVTAVSTHGGGQDLSVLTTTASPIYTLTLTQSANAKTANPGAWVTYTVGLSNTGNAADTFNLTYAGDGSGAPNAVNSIGPISAFSSASFVVTASVPLTALAGSHSNLWVTGASQHISVQASILITTAANTVHNVKVAPTSVVQSGQPGKVITYTLRLTNTGNTADTFNLSYAGSGVNSQSEPSSVGPLNALSGTIFSVTVKVPDAALLNSSDVVTVTAISTQGGGSASSVLTATATAVYTLTLASPSGAQTADPGAWVTYTVWLNNTGNATDTFNLTYAGDGSGAPNAVNSIGPISAFSSASFVITASVPLTALAGSHSNLSVTGVSQHTSVQASILITTVANTVHKVKLSPISATQSSQPGKVITYTLRLTNTGNAADTFNLSYVGNGVNGQSEPSTVGPVNALSGANFNVVVKVSDAALLNSSDVVTVTAVSVQGGGSASSVLTATATAVYTLTLTPPTGAQTADPGGWVTYTVWLSNTGNAADTFNLTYAGDGSGAPNAVNSIGPIGAFNSASFVVTASVPLTALAGSHSNLWVTGASQHTSVQASILITTVANTVHNVRVSPTSAAQSGQPGKVLTYTLRLTNTGNAADTFNLTYAGSGVSGQNEPSSVGPLNILGGTNFLVAVKVSNMALLNSSDVVRVTAISMQGGGSASSVLTATATAVYTLTLTQPANAKTANPGAWVTYTVWLNNTGNTTDTFGLTHAGDGAGLPNALNAIGPIGALSSASFVVTTSVPFTALSGSSSHLWVTGVSQHTSVQASILITAVANTVYGVKLSPFSSAQSGRPGRVITYTLRLTNTGNTTDTFMPSELSYGQGRVTFVPATITYLPAGFGANMLVVITLPATNILTVQDLLIRATSESNHNVSTYAHVYSTIKPYSILLPLIRK